MQQFHTVSCNLSCLYKCDRRIVCFISHCHKIFYQHKRLPHLHLHRVPLPTPSITTTNIPEKTTKNNPATTTLSLSSLQVPQRPSAAGRSLADLFYWITKKPKAFRLFAAEEKTKWSVSSGTCSGWLQFNVSPKRKCAVFIITFTRKLFTSDLNWVTITMDQRVFWPVKTALTKLSFQATCPMRQVVSKPVLDLGL